jgi:hypothetical protein
MALFKRKKTELTEADSASNSPKKTNKPNTLQSDYYLEQGFLVFTETFHKRRGYCCQSGCRHCPYGFNKPTTPPEPGS